MYKISKWNWCLLLTWPFATGYGLAAILPPPNAIWLVLGLLWLGMWGGIFMHDQRSVGSQKTTN